MVDTPTLRNRLRKQEIGTNTNTWGDDKLNEVIDAVDQALDGVESIALTGDLVLSSSNYTVSDQSLNRVLKFTGSLVSAVSVTLPSVEHWYIAVNTAGADVTVKTSGGLGVLVPHGGTVLVYCDGADVLNGAPTVIGSAMTIAGALGVTGAITATGALTLSGQVKGVTTGTESTDAVNKTQMDAAIAAGGVGGALGTAKVDASANPLYMLSLLLAGSGIDISDDGDTMTFTVDLSELSDFTTAQSAISTAQADILSNTGLAEASLSIGMSK